MAYSSYSLNTLHLIPRHGSSMEIQARTGIHTKALHLAALPTSCGYHIMVFGLSITSSSCCRCVMHRLWPLHL